MDTAVQQFLTWMDMIRSRNLTTHTYEETTAVRIADSVIASYFPAFVKILRKMKTLAAEEQS